MWTKDGRDLLPNVSSDGIRDAFTGYYAYSGKYDLDTEAHLITHHIVASLRSACSLTALISSRMRAA
jgi:hypothetical protein